MIFSCIVGSVIKDIIETINKLIKANFLDRLGIVRVSSQFFMIGPNILFFNNQWCNLGDDLAKQAAARSKNTVAGMPGSIMPMTARTIKNNPQKIRRNFFTIKP